MTDIVQRLRSGTGLRMFSSNTALCAEAAGEIDRLRAEIDRRHGIGGELVIARRERDELRAEIERLRKENGVLREALCRAVGKFSSYEYQELLSDPNHFVIQALGREFLSPRLHRIQRDEP